MVRMNRRPLGFPVAAVSLCALMLGACADTSTKVNWEEDKPYVDQALVNLGQRLDGLEEQAHAGMQSQDAQMQALQAENERLSGTIETLSMRIDELEKAQKATEKQSGKHRVVAPVRKSMAAVSRPVMPSVQSEESVPQAPTVDPAVVAEAEKNAYSAAYLALKSGRFDEALAGFNKLLDLYPDGEYADQSWYWLGESHLAQNDSEKAMLAFRYVADHYPESVKHAPALMKLAQIAEMNQQTDSAIRYYKRLIEAHPDSSLAEQARTALAQLTAGSEQ